MTALEGARLLKAQAMRKQAYVPLTPAAQEAMAAQQQGAPMDPAMAQGGMPSMPMDPSMQQGMPMDPSMMGGAPMPMDPAMAQGGMPSAAPAAPQSPTPPVDPAAAGMPMFDNTAEIQGTLAQLMQMQEDQARIQSEQQADIDAANKLSDNTNKVVKKLMDSTNALRREISAYHDNNEKLSAEIESLLDALGVGLNSANRAVR